MLDVGLAWHDLPRQQVCFDRGLHSVSEPKLGGFGRNTQDNKLNITNIEDQAYTEMPSMDYNPRMSMARSSQPQSSQQKPKRDDDEDAFMKLVYSTRRAQIDAT